MNMALLALHVFENVTIVNGKIGNYQPLEEKYK